MKNKRTFLIDNFRVLEKQTWDDVSYFYPQIHLKNWGWYYIFDGKKVNEYLLLKRRECDNNNFYSVPIRYTDYKIADSFRNTIEYTISFMRIVKENKRFFCEIESLKNSLSLRSYIETLEKFITGNYYTSRDDIKVSFRKL